MKHPSQRAAPDLRRENGRKLVPASVRRFIQSRRFVGIVLLLALAVLFWPARELRSENFVFYFPLNHRLLPLETLAGTKYLPLLPVLNTVGKVGGLQEKKNSLKVWFGASQLELQMDDPQVRLEQSIITLPQPVRVENGQWMVPVDFLTTVLPRLVHQSIEYQVGTNRIFIGDVKPGSFTVRMDPLPTGARLTVQFTDKVVVHTASSNGKWVMFLGDEPIEPLEPVYHFKNPYVSELQFDDQDGHPKLVLSPSSTGLNFYPVQAEGGKVLLADVVKPPSETPEAQQAPPTPPAGATSPTIPTPPTVQAPAAPPPPPLPVVALDPGHGGADNGARSRDGVLEKDLMMQYAGRVRLALLATNKYRVVFTRTGDTNVSSDQRALESNLAGAVYFLSLHAADLGAASPRIAIYSFQAPSPPAQGFGVAGPLAFLRWDDVQEDHLDSSRQLGAALQQQFALISGVQVDAPGGAPLQTLRSVNTSAVAIELGRLSPEVDATALTNPVFEQQVATAVVQALANLEKGAP